MDCLVEPRRLHLRRLWRKWRGPGQGEEEEEQEDPAVRGAAFQSKWRDLLEEASRFFRKAPLHKSYERPRPEDESEFALGALGKTSGVVAQPLARAASGKLWRT